MLCYVQVPLYYVTHSRSNSLFPLTPLRFPSLSLFFFLTHPVHLPYSTACTNNTNDPCYLSLSLSPSHAHASLLLLLHTTSLPEIPFYLFFSFPYFLHESSITQPSSSIFPLLLFSISSSSLIPFTAILHPIPKHLRTASYLARPHTSRYFHLIPSPSSLSCRRPPAYESFQATHYRLIYYFSEPYSLLPDQLAFLSST
ncbi:hypothetical protein K445DRAFT_129923 [Daldinia sp. EC12]|nr:hypothetical protein K445DRAFT_129923 [Daldinia sp. EC12]